MTPIVDWYGDSFDAAFFVVIYGGFTIKIEIKSFLVPVSYYLAL